MRIPHRKFYWLIVLLLSVCTANAQTALTNFLMGNSGMPDNTVHAVFAKNGVKWIGTDYGLVKFDNSNWTIYQTGNSGIPGNSVRSILVDDTLAVWIGTFTGGLARLHDTTWTVWNTTNSPLPDDYIRSLALDPAGTVWIGTSGGLVRMRDTSWTHFHSGNSIMTTNNIAAIYTTGADSLWFGTINGGLIWLADTVEAVYSLVNSGIGDNTVLGIDIDGSGALHLATPAGGYELFLQPQWQLFNTVNSTIPSNSLKALAIRPNGEYWAASIDTGIIYSPNFSNWQNYSASLGYGDNHVQCMFWEGNDSLWFGTRAAGLVLLQPDLLTNSIPPNSAEPEIAYPNPFTTRLFVEGGFGVGEVFDFAGRIVGTVQNGQWNDLSNLPGGLFWIRNAKGETIRVVKQ